MPGPRAAASQAARDHYGRLIAQLAARSGDIAAAEDALSDAFAAALRVWPERGIPDRPAAWLMTAARNRMTDRYRKALRFSDEGIPSATAAEDPSDWPDRRLALMLVCTHPAIAADLHAPLILQTVLGIDAERIARLFLVPPAAMAQRLVRAKRKIREAGISFDLPALDMLPLRLGALHEAIYAAHALDWLSPDEALGQESLYLADLVRRMLPRDAESAGLAALIAFGHARNAARLDGGMLVPVDRQDVSRRDDDLCGYAWAALDHAITLARPGRFQTEAMIQSVHMRRKQTGLIDWPALRVLYRALIAEAPSAGALVAQAVVTSQIDGPLAGLEALDRIEAELPHAFQPLWAARARLLALAGAVPEAACAYDRAISMTTESALRRYLQSERDALPSG